MSASSRGNRALEARVARWHWRVAEAVDSNALVKFCVRLTGHYLTPGGLLEFRYGDAAADLGMSDRMLRKHLSALGPDPGLGLLDVVRLGSRWQSAVYALTGISGSGDEHRSPEPERWAIPARQVPVIAVTGTQGSGHSVPPCPTAPDLTGTPSSGDRPPYKTGALPDHHPAARAVGSSPEIDLSLAVNGRPPNGASRVPEREINGHAQPQPTTPTLIDLVRAAQPDMTGNEATAVIAAVRTAGRVDSLTGWAGSPRGQVDIRERLATHRQATRAAVVALPAECPHGCVGGWLGDPDRPAPCPTHKPHRTNGHHG